MKKHKKMDPKLVSSEKYEVAYMAKKLGVTQKVIRDARAKVGRSRARVAAFVRGAAACVVCAIVLWAAAPAHASPGAAACQPTGDVMRPCGAVLAPTLGASTPSQRDRVVRAARPGRAALPRVARADHGTAILAHPAGCPGTNFCGCGASVRVFGHPVRSLYLASAWLRFSRVAPAPGMAAVRPGHVFIMETHIAGDTWMSYDANSGGHQTRMHARSLRGYTIVNPGSG